MLGFLMNLMLVTQRFRKFVTLLKILTNGVQEDLPGLRKGDCRGCAIVNVKKKIVLVERGAQSRRFGARGKKSME